MFFDTEAKGYPYIYKTIWLPKEIQGILEDHIDIVGVDFPNDLPPMMSIIHHYMYLIRGVGLLNKGAYR